MATKKSETSTKRFREVLLGQLTALASGGLGLVAALAWNDAIQTFVKSYIEIWIPGAGIYSKFLYAIIVTLLVVFVTYQTSMLAARFEQSKK